MHCDRRRTGRTDWAALRTLYTALLAVAPSLGAQVALAAVIGRTEGPEAGLAALPADAELLPAVLGHPRRPPRPGRSVAEAAEAAATAVALSDDPAVQAYLSREHALDSRDSAR